MPDLSDLPYELLVKIAKRLRKLEDFTSFRSVSKSLRAAAKDEIRLRQRTPYLMLHVSDGNDDDTREFYSLVEGESIVASMKVPNFKGKRCFESLGWLLVSQVEGSMSLLDPFTGTEIPLPHQNTFPGYVSVYMDEYWFFQKMVLSSRPGETSDFVLMVVGGGWMELAFWRLGDKAWNKIDKQIGAYRDVVYYGGGQFCAISYPGDVWLFNFSRSDNQIESHIVTKFMPGNRIPDHVEDFNSKRLYILKTVDDSLLVISRTSPAWEVDDFSYIATEFQVYEVDIATGTWKEIYSLGSMAVFLGHNSTTAVDASRFPGTSIKANHIYFTDNKWEWYGSEEANGGGMESGVYNLETGTVEPIYPGETLLSKVSPSMWITPCF